MSLFRLTKKELERGMFRTVRPTVPGAQNNKYFILDSNTTISRWLAYLRGTGILQIHEEKADSYAGRI
jgi:hypothetical protein